MRFDGEKAMAGQHRPTDERCSRKASVSEVATRHWRVGTPPPPAGYYDVLQSQAILPKIKNTAAPLPKWT